MKLTPSDLLRKRLADSEKLANLLKNEFFAVDKWNDGNMDP